MTTDSTPQLTRASLTRMTPAQILAAKKAGQLDAIRAGHDGDTEWESQRPEQWTRSDLASASPAQIAAARRTGQLDDLIAGSEATYT